MVAGGFVFLSGMVPENTEADVKGQTQDVLAQIDRWLEKCRFGQGAHPRSHRFPRRYGRLRRDERSVGRMGRRRPRTRTGLRAGGTCR